MKKLMIIRSRWEQIAENPPVFTDFIDKWGRFDYQGFQKTSENWKKALKSAKQDFDQAFQEHRNLRDART